MSNTKSQKPDIVPEYKLIECRQQGINSLTKTQNSPDFEVILPTPIELNPNESLKVGSVFLDTIQSDQGLITLPDTTGNGTCDISMDIGYWLSDIPTTNEGRYRGDFDGPDAAGNEGGLLPPIVPSKNYAPARGATPHTAFDGEKYVACQKLTGTDGANMIQLEGLRLEFTNHYVAHGHDDWFNLELTISDANGQKIPFLNCGLQRPGTDHIIQKLLKPVPEGTGTNGGQQFMILNDDFVKAYNDECNAQGVSSRLVGYKNFPILTRNQPGANDILIFNIADGPGETGIQHVVNLCDDMSKAGLALGHPSASLLRGLTSANTNFASKFQPIRNTITLNLPATSYGAADLSTLIGQNFVGVAQRGDDLAQAKDNLVNNQLLKTSRQLMQDFHDAGNPNDEVHFIRASDGTRSFQLNTIRDISGGGTPPQLANYYIGASNFGLNYNEESSKMNIDLMHIPFLDVSTRDGGGLPETRIYKNATNNEIVGDAYSGIFIFSLSPTTLWRDQFKFNMNDLITGYTEKQVSFANDGSGNPVLSNVPVFDISATSGQDNRLIAGRNITTELAALDSAIIKKRTGAAGGKPNDPTPANRTPQTSANTQAFDLCTQVETNAGFIDYFASTTNEHISIDAKGEIQNNSYGNINAADQSGYYQIEVSINGINTDIKGQDLYNNKIMSVISKYYSSTNYLSSYDEGSTEYFHKGDEPIKISSVKIRVLRSDGTLADELADDNSIFLKITKEK